MSLPAYLRMPALSGDQLVFVCDDDLWSVDADGGAAHRLSDGLGEPAWPCLSADGQWLAYTGRDEHHAEVWLMPAAGGPARRLTWLGADTQVRGWTADGQILFVSTGGQPFVRNHRAFTVDPAGGAPVALGLGQVNHLAVGPGGQRVIGRNTADPARWKRYRGGTAGHLWADATGQGDFTRLTALKGNLSNPMWIGNRIWFLADHEGVGNLYSCASDGSGITRHTDHAEHYARHASLCAAGSGRIVYQVAAELWCLDTAGGQTRRLPIEVPAARTQAARRPLTVADHLHGMALHPQGHSLALDVRGKLFSAALWEGAVQQHGQADGARYRLGQWLADGQTLAVVSDAAGEEAIELHHADRVQPLPWPSAAVGRVLALAAAPRGTRLAWANHRNELWLGDTAGGDPARVDHSDAGRIEDLAWSPCGGWLAYAFWTSARHRAIKLLDVASGVGTLATQAEFHDWAPAFDPAGRYLYFLSNRTFDPVYDSVQFELSFPRAARPYLIALQADARPPFDPRRVVWGDAAKADKGKEKTEAAPLRVDLDGLPRRVAPFPVDEGRFGRIAGAIGKDGKDGKDGKGGGSVLWTRLPIPGAHGRGGHKEGPGVLERFDFATGAVETVMAQVDDFRIAADHATVLVREGQRLRAIAASHKAEDDKTGERKPSRKSGWIDLARVRARLDPRAEWGQMLREIWRLQRDQFWVADLSGVDWDAVWTRYAPLLDRVATRGEFSDLVWEMQGELGTSHAYEMGGDHRKPPALALGQLAADLRWDGDGWAIDRLVAGDAWDPTADSPLAAIGVQARVGERIVAVGGQPVSAMLPPQALLLQQADATVALTLASSAGRRQVTVRPLADETPARYRAWVEANRAWVHAHSGAKVGYLHVPDMMSAGFAEFHRHFRSECDRDGLIVDVRYNRGGHVSQLLLEKLARRRYGYVLARWQRPASYPDEARAGPVVALTNEHAGSDGDIFSHGFKMMGLGTLVGTRTWGGVIGIWPRHTLADGSVTTQPEFSFWFQDVGWGVENFGTDPQIEVDNAPQDALAGRDRQLETALSTVQDAIAREGVSRPAFTARPRLVPPPLPPR